MLKVSRGMLSRDPAGRPSAREVEGMFGELIKRAGIEVHCQPPAPDKVSRAQRVPKWEKVDAYAAPESSSADTSGRDSPSPPDSMLEFVTTGFEDEYIHSSDSE